MNIIPITSIAGDEEASQNRKEVEPALNSESLLEFCQNPYYVEKWEGMLKNNNKSAGFNFYAFILGAHWCFFRKMYKLGAVVILATLLLSFVVGAYYMHLMDLKSSPGAMPFVIGTITSIVLIQIPLGYYANILYYKYAVKNIESIVSSRIPGIYFLSCVKDAGGVNVGALFISLTVFAIVAKFV